MKNEKNVKGPQKEIVNVIEKEALIEKVQDLLKEKEGVDPENPIDLVDLDLLVKEAQGVNHQVLQEDQDKK